MKTPIVLALALTLALVLAGCAPAESTVHLQQELDSDTITVTGRVGLEVTSTPLWPPWRSWASGRRTSRPRI